MSLFKDYLNFDAYHEYVDQSGNLINGLLQFTRLFNSHRILNFTVLKEIIDVISPINSPQIASSGSPFLWLNCKRLFTEHEEIDIVTNIFYLIIQLIDSYSSFLLNKNFQITLPISSRLIFPETQIFTDILNKAEQINITVDSNKEIQIVANNLFINCHFFSPENIDVRGLVNDSQHYLIVDDESIIEHKNNIAIPNPVNVDIISFSENIRQAYELISAINRSGYHLIKNYLTHFIPLTGTLNIHRSLTAPSLPGLIFLSNTTDIAKLAEAIVHEYSHHEMHLYSNKHLLIRNDITDEAKYYSPWRPDPRPLWGLLHGMHAFTEVALFYKTIVDKKAEIAHLLDSEKNYYHIFTLRIHQLILALSQIEEHTLTSHGQMFLQIIEAQVEQMYSLIQEYAPPQALVNHLEAWIENNPDYNANTFNKFDERSCYL
jgi:hypothetical protein